MDALNEVNTSVFVRGNWDDVIAEVCDELVDLDDPEAVYVTALVAWLLDRIAPAQARTVRGWPLTVRREVDGVDVLVCHNLPTRNHGEGLLATARTDELEALCDGADVVVFGHWHEPALRWSGRRQLIVGPGSVGQAWRTRAGASGPAPAEYAILRIGPGGTADVDFRCVAYDHHAEAPLAHRSGLPYAELYEKHLATGAVFQHDPARLTAVADRHGYRAVAGRFLAGRAR